MLAVPASAITNLPQQGGAKWPGRTITYFDGSLDHAAVARGVAVWNASGVRIRFVRSYSRKRAQLIIRNSRDVPTGSCGGGMATDGYVRPHAYVNILHGSVKDGMRCSVYAQTLVVAHELGHVLGFGHDDARCSVMNSAFLEGYAPAECVGAEGLEPHRGSWDCRLLERIDVVRTARRYGGTATPRPAEQWCDFVPRRAAPTITARWDRAGGGAHLTIRRPASVRLPAFLLAEDRHPERYDVISSAACHPDPPTEQEM